MDWRQGLRRLFRRINRYNPGILINWAFRSARLFNSYAGRRLILCCLSIFGVLFLILTALGNSREEVHAPKNRFPWMVSIRQETRMHRCGAFLISPHHVLTAAHCVLDENQKKILNSKLYIGAYGIDDTEINGVKMARAHATIIHPKFNDSKSYDIAILKLQDSVEGFPILTLPELGKDVQLNTHLVALGWGAVNSDSFPDKLKWIKNLEVVRRSFCKSDQPLICMQMGKQGISMGDSGGPVLLPDVYKGKFGNGSPGFDLAIGVISTANIPNHDGSGFATFVNLSHPEIHEWIEFHLN